MAVALLCALPALASAHAGFAAVDAGPERVRVEFDAAVETAFLRLVVRDRAGAVVSGPVRRDVNDPRAIVADLDRPAPGGTASWRVLSQDGHAGGGTIALADGVTVPGSDAVEHGDAALPLVARLLLLVAPLGLLGMAVLAGWVVAPAVRAGGIVPPGPGADREGFRARAAVALGAGARRWWWAWWALLVVGALGVALQPVALLWTLHAGAGDLWELLTATRAGRAWWCILAGLAVAAAAGALVRRPRDPAGGLPTPGACWALGIGPAAALAAISWSGHASTGKDRTANIVIDLLHNLATAAWIGGLVGLAAVLPMAARRLGDPDRVRLCAAVVVRFSSLAVAAVAVLVVTGVYRALAELETLADLVDTAYGRALLVKLGLFAALLVFGAVNRFVIHPRLERAALGLDEGDRGAGARLTRSLSAEIVLALALLVAVAVMLGLAPPR